MLGVRAYAKRNRDNMVYSTRQMHDIALARALENGPKILHIGDDDVAAYALSKKELYKLFVDHGYSADRTRWISTIQKWGDERLWNDVVAKEMADKNNWSCHVVFREVDKDNLLKLLMFAEDRGIPAYPKRYTESLVA